MKLVWVPIRHGASKSARVVYHDSLECGQARGNCVPTGVEFAERAGLQRCRYCETGGGYADRRAAIVALRERGMTFTAIATRLAGRWDVSKQVVHKDYQRAVAERERAS